MSPKIYKGIKTIIGNFFKDMSRPHILKNIFKEFSSLAKKKPKGLINLPDSIRNCLRGSKIIKTVQLKDGRTKVWTAFNGHIERCIFSAGEKPQLVKKSVLSNNFITKEIHKGAKLGLSDSGYSITYKLGRNIDIINVSNFNETIVRSRQNNMSEWQVARESISRYIGKDKKSKCGMKSLEVKSIFNNGEKLSKPIFYQEPITYSSMTIKEALQQGRHNITPNNSGIIYWNGTNDPVFKTIGKTCQLPTTIRQYQALPWIY